MAQRMGPTLTHYLRHRFSLQSVRNPSSLWQDQLQTCGMATINLSAQSRSQVLAGPPGEVALLTADLAGNITGCNKAAIRMFAGTHGEVVGQPLKAFIPAEVEAGKPISSKQLITGVMQSGQRTFSISQQAADGRCFTIELSISLMRDRNSAPTGLVALFTTVEKFKAA